MTDPRLSMATQRLLAAAKADVPSTAARAKMWADVSSAVGTAAGATSITASSLLGGGASATKLLSLGALFGGTITVGLAAMLLHVGPVPAPPASAVPPSAMGHAAPRAPHEPSVPPAVESAPPPAGASAVAPPAASAAAPRARSRLHHRHNAAHDDPLAREASLVSAARSALAKGDPRAALRAVREARALPAGQLAPEELAVEEQALRALGQSDEANGIEVQLRLQYPDSDLAR